MIIGVTGGVGTGKSTILNLLQEEYHAAVIISDDVARELMLPGNPVYDRVIEEFGPQILTDGPGSLIDRKVLAQVVFQDPAKLQRLNGLVHPAVKEEITSRIEEYQKAGYSMIVVETAILIEAGYEALVDELWVVYADYEIRAARLAESRGYSREKIDSIIRNQMSPEEMAAHAQLVIDNSGDLESVKKQIRNHLLNEKTDN